MKLLFYLFISLSLPASAQISIKGDEAYFSNGTKEYRLNRYKLTTKEHKRIFSNRNRSTFWGYLNGSDPEKSDLKSSMSSVKSQGQRGSCSTFAAMALVEHFHDNNADYSEQCLAIFSNTKDETTIIKALEYVRGGYILSISVPIEIPKNIPNGLPQPRLKKRNYSCELAMTFLNLIFFPRQSYTPAISYLVLMSRISSSPR